MKIQRKLLTKKQKDDICNKHSKDGKCNGACPLAMNSLPEPFKAEREDKE